MKKLNQFLFSLEQIFVKWIFNSYTLRRQAVLNNSVLLNRIQLKDNKNYNSYHLIMGDSYSSNVVHGIHTLFKNRKSHSNKVNLPLLDDDHNTYISEHSMHTSQLAILLGNELNLSDYELEELRLAALYHDIGKTKIPVEIINKPGPLNDQEWQIMKRHTLYSYHLLLKYFPNSKIPEYAKYHHERIDGKGYPEGLKGYQIPKLSRILTIVDAYEAMTSNRPYKKALSKKEAIKELYKHAGQQFDEKIVDVFIKKILKQQ